MKGKVGDIIVGLESANIYTVTCEGWVGKITKIIDEGIYVTNVNPDERKRTEPFLVAPAHFAVLHFKIGEYAQLTEDGQRKYHKTAAWKGLVRDIQEHTLDIGGLPSPVEMKYVRPCDAPTGKPHEFKVGDKVIGNKKAKVHYSITKTGWIGYVNFVDEDGSRIRVDEDKDNHATGYWVDPKCFDLFVAVDDDAEPEEKKEDKNLMSRAELFGKLFLNGRVESSSSWHPCPVERCDDCPAKDEDGRCSVQDWWSEEIYVGRPAKPKNTEEPKHDGLEKLCYHYNRSDIEALTYIKEQDMCKTDREKHELEQLILLNDLIYVYNSDKYDEKVYRIRYCALLRGLGISIDKEGYARIKK